MRYDLYPRKLLLVVPPFEVDLAQEARNDCFTNPPEGIGIELVIATSADEAIQLIESGQIDQRDAIICSEEISLFDEEEVNTTEDTLGYVREDAEENHIRFMSRKRSTVLREAFDSYYFSLVAAARDFFAEGDKK